MLIIHPPVSTQNAAQAIVKAMQDERLSLRARGLLGLLLSHSGDAWECGNLKSLAVAISNRQRALTGKVNGEGQQAIYATLCEIEKAGYLARRVVGDGVNPKVHIEVLDSPGAWEAIPAQEDQDGNCDVYVIGQHGSSIVKIGTTASLQNRLRNLQSGYPLRLEILWRTPGGWGLEQYLHSHFAEKRLQGEWFDFGEEDPVDSVHYAAMERKANTGSGA